MNQTTSKASARNVAALDSILQKQLRLVYEHIISEWFATTSPIDGLILRALRAPTDLETFGDHSGTLTVELHSGGHIAHICSVGFDANGILTTESSLCRSPKRKSTKRSARRASRSIPKIITTSKSRSSARSK